MEKKPRKQTKKKEFRHSTSFTMRFDNFSLGMVEKIAYDEDRSRPEVIRAAVKLLFLKKYGQKEIEKLRKQYRHAIE